MVVIGADPLGGIDGAFFQGLVNLATRNVLWHAAQALNDFARKAAHTEFQALDVGQGLDFLAVPAPHLRTRIAGGEIDDVVLLVKLTHELQAIALEHPRRHLAAVQAKRNGAAQRKSFVFAKEVVRSGVRHFYCAILYTIHHTKRRHQLARCVGRNHKLAAAQFANLFHKGFGGTVNGVKRLGKA